MRDGYDVVVVGAGSSGSVVAARLSQDPARHVLLLEAGRAPRAVADFPPELLDAGILRGADPGQSINWTFPARLTQDRAYDVVRGRILGGSSTINGAYFIRPRLSDFTRWVDLTGSGAWSYEHALPVLKAMESDMDYGATAIHGGSGPIPVSRTRLDHPAAEAFGEAAAALGFPFEKDKNDQGNPGFGAVPRNVADGVRQNAGLAYVLPALTRPNLTVRGDTLVEQVLFDGRRATGVALRDRDGRHAVHADLVVVCAGAIKSAQLLLLSGIGPAAHLRELGVPVRQDAAVGTAFADHPQIVVEWLPSDPIPTPDGTWLGGALHAGDLEILGTLSSMSGLLRPVAQRGTPLALMASDLTPRRTGRLRLTSTDPADLPHLDFCYLSTADDRRRLRDAVRLCVDLLQTPPWRRTATVLGPDARTVADDGLLDAWVAEHLGTAQHTCATIPCGGPETPVDAAGRVRGVDDLVVADTSILPTPPTRGPAVSALLAGEIVARRLAAG